MYAVRIRTGTEAKYFRREATKDLEDREMIDTSMKPTGGPYPNRINSQVSFIHGLLSPRCLSSCASNPVLFAAIGRRLGYPVKLVLTPNHIFNRWVDDTETFNMDGSMKRIGGDADHHYVDRWGIWKDWQHKSKAFHRPLTPREELATFMFNRSNCEYANLRFEAALRTVQLAAKLQPDHLAYVHEQSVIRQYMVLRRDHVAISLGPTAGHNPQVVTAIGCFSVNQIRV